MFTEFTTRLAMRPALGMIAAGMLLTVGCSKNPTPEVSTGSVALPSMSSATSAAAPLLNSITTAVPGLSQEQAMLATGSVLGLAKAKMPADQYTQLANAFPSSEALLSGAQKAGLPSSSNLTGLSSVTDFLGKAGISPQQVSQLVPVLGNAVKKINPTLGEAFMSALR